jgi:hypothetical protein
MGERSCAGRTAGFTCPSQEDRASAPLAAPSPRSTAPAVLRHCARLCLAGRDARAHPREESRWLVPRGEAEPRASAQPGRAGLRGKRRALSSQHSSRCAAGWREALPRGGRRKGAPAGRVALAGPTRRGGASRIGAARQSRAARETAPRPSLPSQHSSRCAAALCEALPRGTRRKGASARRVTLAGPTRRGGAWLRGRPRRAPRLLLAAQRELCCGVVRGSASRGETQGRTCGESRAAGPTRRGGASLKLITLTGYLFMKGRKRTLPVSLKV